MEVIQKVLVQLFAVLLKIVLYVIQYGKIFICLLYQYVNFTIKLLYLE